MSERFAYFVLAVIFTLGGNANMYNNWAQKNAVNLDGVSMLSGETKPVPQNADMMADRIKAADLLNSVPPSSAGVLDALVNELTPAPKSFLEALKDPNLELQSAFASMWHNFADGVLSENSSPKERLAAMMGAAYEFFGKDRSSWKYLDPKMPNAKFLSKDGRSEFVYNIYTGNQVKTGINAATSNQYGLNSKVDGLLHIIRDAMIRYPEQGTPSEVDQKVAKYLATHPEMREEFMRRAEELSWPNFLKQIWNEVEKLIIPPAGEADELKKLKESETGKQQVTESEKTYIEDVKGRGNRKGEDREGLDDSADHIKGGTSAGQVASALNETPRSTEEGSNDQGTRAAKDDTVGVRGWCRCGENHGRFYLMGMGAELDFKADGSRFDAESGDYTYRLCGRCGRVDRPWRKKGADGEVRIRDNRIEKKYGEQAGSDIPLSQYEAMLRQSEDRLMDIPDGQVVIPGMCRCNEPDPIRTGFVDSQEEFFVCCFCGRVRVLDETGEMPIGPTAWAAMMGNSKPFPGYGNRKK